MYTIDQLQDDNATRSRQFRYDLLSFLGLIHNANATTTTPPDNDLILKAFQLGHENMNRFTTDQATAHAETIRLCPSPINKDKKKKKKNNNDDKKNSDRSTTIVMPEALRRRFVAESRTTAEWIEQRVLSSSSSQLSSSSSLVTVSNREHFFESLQAWKVDPCRLQHSSST